MLTIGAVSYLNTKPYLLGLKDIEGDKFKVIEDYPSHIADQFLNSRIDIALLPVAVLKEIQDYEIAAPYGIAANGIVDTVCLFTKSPINEIDTIYLDYQSRTSVLLMQILCAKYLSIQPKFLPLQDNMLNEFPEKNSGILVIGDRVIPLLGNYPYSYDLATLWKKYTDLPFVFAIWVANKALDDKSKETFKIALETGVLNVEKVIAQNKEMYDTTSFSVSTYLSKRIQFRLTEEHFKGMQKFLYLLDEL